MTSRRPHAPRCARVFLLTSLAALPQAHAQTSPPSYGIGDAIRQVQTPAAAVAPRPRPQVETEPAPVLLLPSDQTLEIRAFEFEGAALIPEELLQAELQNERGHALSLAQMQAAAGKITALYRRQGYVLARAYLPRQDARSGTLRIRVVVGQVGAMQLNNQSLVDSEVLGGFFSPVQQAPSMNRAQLERAMLLVGDLPGAQMPRVSVAPGNAAGSTDLTVQVPAGPRWGGYALADNSGSRYTGTQRLSAHLELNSPLGLGDQLSLHAMDSSGGDLLNARLAYSLALGNQGLRAELAGAKTQYELGDSYRDLGASGSARTLEATLSYPVLRQREADLRLSLNLATRHMRDDIAADASELPKTAQLGTLSAQYEHWGNTLGRASNSRVGASLSAGSLRITDAAQATSNQAGANTVGNWAHLNLNLTCNVDWSAGWSSSMALALQKALRNKNLDPSEQMNIAGPSGVKAYRESVSGDNGYLLSAELRRALPTLGEAALQHTLGGFVDLGRVAYQQGDYATHNGQSLADVGLSYSARYAAFLAKLQWARAVGDQPSSALSRSRVLVQLGLNF